MNISISTAIRFSFVRSNFTLQSPNFLLISSFYSITMVQWNNTLLQFLKYTFSHRFKSSFYFSIIFGVYFDKVQPIFICHFLTLLITYFSLSFKIVLIGNQQNLHIRVSISFYLFQPSFNMLKCLFTCYIINKQSPNSTSIVRPGDGPKVLLACSVPNLQFNSFFLDIYCFSSELNTYGYIVGSPSLILYELKDYT